MYYCSSIIHSGNAAPFILWPLPEGHHKGVDVTHKIHAHTHTHTKSLLELLLLNVSTPVLVQNCEHFFPICIRWAVQSHLCKERLEVKCARSYIAEREKERETKRASERDDRCGRERSITEWQESRKARGWIEMSHLLIRSNDFYSTTDGIYQYTPCSASLSYIPL